MRVLVTGGAGFIGAHVTEALVAQGHTVCVATRNTYAGKLCNLQAVLPSIALLLGDLAEPYFAEQCADWAPDWVVHMAAETHVDHAIADPLRFIRANVVGTTTLLQAVCTAPVRPSRILIYSTDEVFGPTPPGVLFDEQAPFKPSNAYSASKVGVEAVTQAFWTTHRLPVLLVRPCNTFGPRQHPEKVIPKFVRQMLRGESVTVYNDGHGARDWLHVADHARAVLCLLAHGTLGQGYNLAAGEEHTDTDIAAQIWHVLLTLRPLEGWMPAPDLTYVPGRPGHDRRYAMDGTKLRALGWRPQVPFADGLRETVLWNIIHHDWWETDVMAPGVFA